METTAAHTHTPHGNHNGNATCARCGAHITMVYTARHADTGAIETFGSDCHYQVTGVDTRQARAEQARAARTQRARQQIPAAELAILDKARAAIAHVTPPEVESQDQGVYFDLRDWDTRWSPANLPLGEWLQKVASNGLGAVLADPLAAALPELHLDRVHGKAMAARFGGTCGTCGARIGKGDPIIYNSGSGAHCAAHGAN